jgi:hypothetical protein
MCRTDKAADTGAAHRDTPVIAHAQKIQQTRYVIHKDIWYVARTRIACWFATLGYHTVSLYHFQPGLELSKYN